MKVRKSFAILSLTILFTQSAHAGFFSSIVHFLSHVPIIGNVVDHYANKAAHGKVTDKLNGLYNSAMSCSPLEKDGSVTVKEFMKLKPGYPDWQALEKFESVSTSVYNKSASLTSQDKVRHCLAGCFIRKELGVAAGKLAAFTKELKDASDCKSDTHFEMEDYYATLAGVEAGGKTGCESFCMNRTKAIMSGPELLEAAREISVPRANFTQGRLVRVMEQ